MNHIETLAYINKRIKEGKRIVVARYGDGEYIIMNKQRPVAKETLSVLPGLLKRAIKTKGQLVCTVDLKRKNKKRKDLWFRSMNYLMKTGKQDLYGAGKFIRRDFVRNGGFLHYIFSGKVLLVTGLKAEAEVAFKDTQPNLEIYHTLKKHASKHYEKVRTELTDKCKNNYDNIILACGPMGKVLVADLVDKCESNLIDIGSVLNAILNKQSIPGKKPMIKQWSMSWSKNHNINALVDVFFAKLKERNK